MLKQNLFEGGLDSDSTTDEVDFSSKGRGQFLPELENTISEFEEPLIDEMVEEEKEITLQAEQVSDEIQEPDQQVLEEIAKPQPRKSSRSKSTNSTQSSSPSSEGNNAGEAATSAALTERAERMEQMETVMNQGLQFLSGLYKMSTGKDMAAGEQKVEIDKETGEVVMRFKIDF